MPELKKCKSYIAASLLWSAVLFLTIFIYFPGLYGPFIFDDFGSLSKLGSLGGVKDWDTFLAFVFGGTAGPTGRPISLLTFLIDSTNWPAEPWPFKRTNLIVHLLNGSLVGIISFQILTLLSHDRTTHRRVAWVAIAAAAMWLLHPFLISTTLYVVQRMTQLSALFCFVGIAGYLYGRALTEHKTSLGYFWMSASIGFGTLCAMFSKENGALLPILIWVIEATVVSNGGRIKSPLNKNWYRLFIILPSVSIFFYLVYISYSDYFFSIIPSRGFSIYERLLTQARILFIYLNHWFVPELFTSGIFHDYLTKSTGLLSPITTIVALFSHLLIVVTAIIQRHRWPLASFAILFFYSAHLLESTIIPLELYFEHRNYLAASFLFLPICYFLFKSIAPRLFGFLVIVIISVLAGLTYYSASIWSNYPSMVSAWAQKAPDSPRAQQQASMVLYNEGRYAEAMAVLERATLRIPNDLPLQLWKVTIACKINLLQRQDIELANRLAEMSYYDLRAIDLYELYVETITQKTCPNLSIADGMEFFESMLLLPRNSDKNFSGYAQIQYFLGTLEFSRGRLEEGMAYYNRSLKTRPSPDHAMYMAAVLATKGYLNEALLLSQKARIYIGDGHSIATGQTVDDFLQGIEAFETQIKLEISDHSSK